MTITTRPLVVSTLIAGALTLGISRPSEAALFLRIAANAASVSCDNSTAGGVTACSANGFVTSLDSSVITFNGNVGGYGISGLNITSNGAGSASTAYVVDSKFDVTHSSGAGDLSLTFAGFNFTQPVGPNLLLSGSQTAAWTTSAAGDSVSLQVGGRTDNLPTIPGPTATAVPATLVSPGGANKSASSSSGDVPFTRLATPFALTGSEVIHQAIGDVASYSVAVAASTSPGGAVAATAVPEPTSLLLLGTGVLGLIRLRRKK